MKIKLLTVLFALNFLSGCALTVHDLPVNYEYKNKISLPNNSSLPEVTILDIKDTRTVTNPRMIMHQKNGYGQTMTGGWQAEKALSLIVKDAIEQGIANASLNNNNSNRKVQLDGQLVDVSSSVISGWLKGTINMKVTVKLTARDMRSDEILWRDTLFGDGSSGKQSAPKPALIEAFSNSLNDLVDNLFSDEYFQQKVLN
jgi:uncharacterized lipoprotein YajG